VRAAPCSGAPLRALAPSSRPHAPPHSLRTRHSAADADDEPAPPSPLERLKALAESGADAATLVRARAPRAAAARTQPPRPLRLHQSLGRSRAPPPHRAAQEALAADMEAALTAAHDRAAAASAAAAEADTAVKAGKDSLLRLNAEFQNFRNRTEREKSARGARSAARPHAPRRRSVC
jgi:hypothetical protein